MALLGRGGMGEVYRADDLTLGQPVALKFLPQDLITDPERLAQFRTEVRTGRQVSHPNVCRVYDIAEADGHHFLSMEFVDGEDLASLLRRIGRLPRDKGVEIARQICAGLAAAHQRGVVHRDLKPANVMIDGRGHVRIADFGLAHAGEQVESGVAGTPAYMAPEQFDGRRPTIASDIYALGLVLFELFTGQRAFGGTSMPELARAHRELTPFRATSVTEDLDPDIDAVIQRCLAKDPAARPSSALSISAALPGGDPLAAALARGETPSPELVAAAGGESEVRPAVALGALLFVMVGLAVSIWLSGSTKLIRVAPLPRSPDVLRDRAQQLVADLGYSAPPAAEAAGFQHSDYVRELQQRRRSGSAWAEARTGQPSALLFWYRRSPEPLVALSFTSAGQISQSDPPVQTPGMISVWLDTHGRLYAFQAVPQPVVDHTARANPIEWSALFAAAGFDILRFREVAPQHVPPVYADTRAAWTGVYPDNPEIPIHIEAASLRGRPVHFEILESWRRTSGRQPRPSSVLFVVVAISLLLSGAALAVRHVRLGRGDLRRATRLAAVVFALRLVSTAARAGYSAASEAAFLILALLLAQALLMAGLAWAGYVALEPYVRRRWPDVLISWTRLLSGKWWDSRVGRDALFGLVAAITLTLAGQLSQVLAARFGGPADLYTPPPWVLDGGRFVFGALLQDGVRSVIWGFALLLLLFLATRIVRRTDIAVVLFIALFAVQSFAAANSLIAVPLGILYAALGVFVLLHLGVLALIVVMLILPMVDHYPLTFDLRAWYAPYGWLPIVCLVGLAAFAFRASIGRKPIFGGFLPND